ncbi:MAG: hypothetical protein WC501_00745 [Candidatus Micrarchaeia archaeon]
MKVGEFNNYLKERFGLVLPKGAQFSSDSGSAIRIYSTTLNSIKMDFGFKGFVAYSKKTGISNEFIQIFGKYAQKNLVFLNEAEAKEFTSGKKINKKIFLKKGPVILKYLNHILGIATFDGKFLFPKLKEKRKREILNSIGQYAT